MESAHECKEAKRTVRIQTGKYDRHLYGRTQNPLVQDAEADKRGLPASSKQVLAATKLLLLTYLYVCTLHVSTNK